MKVYIYKDELWPYFGISESGYSGDEIEVDRQTLRRWQRVLRKFMEVQNEMEKTVEEAERTKIVSG